MEDNEIEQRNNIEDALSSRRWRPLLLLVVALSFMAFLYFLQGIHQYFTTWILTRDLAISVFGGLALVMPPKDLQRVLGRFVYIVGPATYAIVVVIVNYGHRRALPGEPLFYQMCALTLPILLLAILIDSHLFESSEAQPIWIFLNLVILVAGEGASLLAIASGYGSRGVFANTVASIIAAFAIIVANAVSKVPVPPPPNDSRNSISRFVSWIRS